MKNIFMFVVFVVLFLFCMNEIPTAIDKSFNYHENIAK